MKANVALGTCLLRLSSCIVRPASCAAMIAVLLGASADIALSQDQSAATFKDEIFARKIMMDSIDDHMDAIDWMLTSGRAIDLNKSFEHADAISIMLMAFPHLFSSGTNQWRADANRDPARDTFASPDVWANFADFYQQAAAASRLAYNASRTKQEAHLRETMAALRNACEACHASYLKADP